MHTDWCDCSCYGNCRWRRCRPGPRGPGAARRSPRAGRGGGPSAVTALTGCSGWTASTWSSWRSWRGRSAAAAGCGWWCGAGSCCSRPPRASRSTGVWGTRWPSYARSGPAEASCRWSPWLAQTHPSSAESIVTLIKSTVQKDLKQGRKEMFYLTTHSTHFILRLYGIRHMVKDHSDGLLFPINSKGSFICTIPQTG